MCEYKIEKFTADREIEWDLFVNEKSVNGTFLQTRNFINYHPKSRFIDCSLMVYKKNTLVAVVPACEVSENGRKIFYSHKGSTYGGIIVSTEYYKTERLIDIVRCIDEHLSKKYEKSILKITADIHSKERSDLLQYVLSYFGYSDYTELNTYIDLKSISENVEKTFDRNKLRNIHKCEEHGLTFKEIRSDEDVKAFYDLLEINLKKYDLKPIHTFNEIKELKDSRIPDNVRFFGVFQDETMMAGGMMFIFDNCNVIHAQNLSADYRFIEYSPITYLYYRIIRQVKEDGYRALSWGISTEDKGRIINLGLVRNKESYGSKYIVNRTYFKEYSI